MRKEGALPSSPYSVDIHALGNIDNEFDIGVVVVIGTARDFYVMISHADIIGIGLQILRRGHDGEMDCPLIAEGLVCPFPDRADLLDGGNTVVGNKHLVRNPLLAPRFYNPQEGGVDIRW